LGGRVMAEGADAGRISRRHGGGARAALLIAQRVHAARVHEAVLTRGSHEVDS
jgi:hypothetical protein